MLDLDLNLDPCAVVSTISTTTTNADAATASAAIASAAFADAATADATEATMVASAGDRGWGVDDDGEERLDRLEGLGRRPTLATAVGGARMRTVVHGDLKAENLFFARRRRSTPKPSSSSSSSPSSCSQWKAAAVDFQWCGGGFGPSDLM